MVAFSYRKVWYQVNYQRKYSFCLSDTECPSEVFGIDCKQECRCAAGAVYLNDIENAMVAFS